MSETTDTVVTIVLFVALIPAVIAAVFVGLHMAMLGDGVSDKRGFSGVLLGVVGVPIGAVAVYVAAVVLAWNTDGYTFFYPVVALLVGALLTVGLSGLADRIVRRR
ncbi:hypothetical protein ACXPWS_26905 [Mycobacterium sp. BMJ-28]